MCDGPEKYPFLKLPLNLTQVLPDQPDLRRVGWIPGDHALNATVSGLGEKVGRCRQLERLHVGAAASGRSLTLALSRLSI